MAPYLFSKNENKLSFLNNKGEEGSVKWYVVPSFVLSFIQSFISFIFHLFHFPFSVEPNRLVIIHGLQTGSLTVKCDVFVH